MVYSRFKDNILGYWFKWYAIHKQINKGFRFLLCVIDIFSKYTLVAPLKDKKGVSIVDAFQKILDNSNRKPNKIRVYKVSDFYNSFLKKWLKDNDIETEMYTIHNEGKSVVAERLLEHERLKSINTWLWCRKMYILIN